MPRFSPSTVRKVALAAVVCYALLMVTGAAVRLTGSGLGCSDWPSCYANRLTAQASFHPLVEFSNRLLSVGVTVVSVVALVVAWLRVPRRRDLCWQAAILVGGIIIQIPLGGIVVLTNLNPYVVALHFLITIPLVADAVIFFHAAGIPDDHDERAAVSLVSDDLRWLARILVAALALVTSIGTIVAGAGPHAGAPTSKTQPVQRVPIAFRDIASLHSDAALFLIGLSLAGLFAFHRGGVTGPIQRRLRLLFELLVVQGTLGYIQYALHDNPVVVEFHVVGVTCLWIVAVSFYLSLHKHPLQAAATAKSEADAAEPVPEPLGPRRAAVPAN